MVRRRKNTNNWHLIKKEYNKENNFICINTIKWAQKTKKNQINQDEKWNPSNMICLEVGQKKKEDEKWNPSNLIWLEVGQKKKEIVDIMQTKVRIEEIFKNLRELHKPENNNPKKIIW
jgi:hypothetical protein